MNQIIRFPHYQFQVIQFRPPEVDPLTPAEADPLASTEGVFSHSVPSTEAAPDAPKYVHGRSI